MTESYRYEMKFILAASNVATALSWMYTRTGARRAYPARIVNSVYFDDPGFTSVRDNLSGFSERRKIRLRWYHHKNKNDADGAVFEIKNRKGRLGRKEKFDLKDFEKEILSTSFGGLFEKIHCRIGGHDKFLVEDHLVPTLHVSYRREYFVGLDDVRVTFDHPISFYATHIAGLPFQTSHMPYTPTIMEIKFGAEKKDDVAQSLRHCHFVPMRHSKYLAGLSALGYAIY